MPAFCYYRDLAESSEQQSRFNY